MQDYDGYLYIYQLFGGTPGYVTINGVGVGQAYVSVSGAVGMPFMVFFKKGDDVILGGTYQGAPRCRFYKKRDYSNR